MKTLAEIAEQFAANRACVVASTYCNSWIFTALDPADPFDSMARAYTELFIVRSDGAKERVMETFVRDFQVDGILFQARSLLAMLALSVTARRPSAATSSAKTCAAASSSSQLIATSAPAAAKARTVASPIPCCAPVISARLPSSEVVDNVMLGSFCRRNFVVPNR